MRNTTHYSSLIQQTYSNHLDHIRSLQSRDERKISSIRSIQIGYVCLVIGFAAYTTFAIWTHWELISSFGPEAQFITITVVFTLGACLCGIALMCESHIDGIRQRLLIADTRLDISMAVYTAIADYVGHTLPHYRHHLNTFGLAEDLYQISGVMSERFDRTYQSVQQSLQEIDARGGLAGIKHEGLKAEALAEFFDSLFDDLSRNEAVVALQAADENIHENVIRLNERLREAQ